MNFDDTPEEAAFRAQLRQWLADNLPADWFDHPPHVGRWDEAFAALVKQPRFNPTLYVLPNVARQQRYSNTPHDKVGCARYWPSTVVSDHRVCWSSSSWRCGRTGAAAAGMTWRHLPLPVTADELDKSLVWR